MGTVSASVDQLNAADNARVHVGHNIYHSENPCLAALRITDPRHDKARIEDDKGGLLDDVYQWVLSNDEFLRWRHDEQNRLLWIRGDPGKGKTMLLCGIINKLQEDGAALSYFFCQATDARINSASAVLRGLIYMLIDQQPFLVSHVQQRYDHAGRQLFEDVNAWVALRDILMDMLCNPALQCQYLIVDALDECQTGRSELLTLIAFGSAASPVKWIVSSRNWPEIEEDLAAAGQSVPLSLELNAESVSAAVQLYIQEKVQRLAVLKQYDTETTVQVRNYLLSNARDTFLWAALVCRRLENVPRVRALRTLRTLPPGLNALYARMMQRISSIEDPVEVTLCIQILSTASTVYRPLTLEELRSFVDNPFQEGEPLDSNSLEYYVGLCGSFLAIRQHTMHFVHQSAKDFLCDPSLNAHFHEIFPSTIERVHHEIFTKSLQLLSRTLRRDIYRLSHPGTAVEDATPPNPDPLGPARYSCVYWVDHLFDAQARSMHMGMDNLQDWDGVHVFLCEKYINWLEALSLVRHMPKAVIAMDKLQSLLQHTAEGPELGRLCNDMRRFVLAHRFAIESAPLQVYTSALVFSPTQSLTRQLFQEEEPTWLVSRPAMDENWSACLATFEGHSLLVYEIAFSPDSRQLVSASADKTVKLWDARTGACIKTFEGHSDSVNSVVFSPDGRQLASASEDKTVRLWDARTGVSVTTFGGHNDTVFSVVFSPDGQQLASASLDGIVKLWDVSTRTCFMTFVMHNDSVNSVAFSPDGRQLALASQDEAVRLWDTRTGACVTTFEGHSSCVESVVFSPDGTQLASASQDETAKLWDASTGICVTTFAGHRSYVNSVAFSPDGRQLASASHDMTVKLWDVMAGLCVMTFEGHNSYVSSVAFSPDGQQLASASWDETVKLWDATAHAGVTTFEARTGMRVAMFGHSSFVNSVVFSPDGQQFASSSLDTTVKLWDARTGNCITTFEGHSNRVFSVVFSPNGRQLASASEDDTVKLWDARTSMCVMTFTGHNDWVYSVAFSPDGEQLASSSFRGTVKLWDARTGRCVTTFAGHTSSVASVTFSPDGRQLASASNDMTVRLWDVSTGQCVMTLEAHNNYPHTVAFSPDGQRLASASSNRSIRLWDLRLWDLATGECLQAINVGTKLYWLSFDAPGSCLRTDIGVILLEPSVAHLHALQTSEQPRFQGLGISADKIWITCNGQNLLWLPPEHRPVQSAVLGSTVVVGCALGRVLFFRFLDEVSFPR